MYDTIIIGGGPGGYLAAERLGQKKKKVLLIEERHLGGTCLNLGCIPTKTLINSAKHYAHAKEAEKFGVKAENVSYDWKQIQAWKNEVVLKLRSGIDSQMKRYGVEVIRGRGEIVSAASGEKAAIVRTLSQSSQVTGEYEGKTILISTGSASIMPPIPGAKENPLVIDSAWILNIREVPKRLVVIGGGVIGVEFAGLFSALGTEVSVIEMMDEIVPFMDHDQAAMLRRAMKDINFMLGCKVERIEGGIVHYSDKKGEAAQVEGDLILMAVGRRPLLENWGAANAGIDTAGHIAPNGRKIPGVTVDDRMRTNISGIWAVGDITGRSLLAHSAYRMAEVAAADILTSLGGALPGEAQSGKVASGDRMRYDAIPWGVYGMTEAAGVGITEQDAVTQGIEVLKATLPMRVSGRFVAENTFTGQGAVKVIAHAKDRRILGIHAVGPYASEFIWGGTAIIEQELRIEDVKQLIFPHPTVSEVIRDAVWALE